MQHPTINKLFLLVFLAVLATANTRYTPIPTPTPESTQTLPSHTPVIIPEPIPNPTPTVIPEPLPDLLPTPSYTPIPPLDKPNAAPIPTFPTTISTIFGTPIPPTNTTQGPPYTNTTSPSPATPPTTFSQNSTRLRICDQPSYKGRCFTYSLSSYACLNIVAGVPHARSAIPDGEFHCMVYPEAQCKGEDGIVGVRMDRQALAVGEGIVDVWEGWTVRNGTEGAMIVSFKCWVPPELEARG